MRMGPAALDVQSKKYPTILTPKDGGQIVRMMRPIAVIPCGSAPTSLRRQPRSSWSNRRTIWIQIHVARQPVRELNHANTTIAIICNAYPPIGMAFICETLNRFVPSAFFSAFCVVSWGYSRCQASSRGIG